MVFVHNHGAFVPSLARIYGNDYRTVFARSGSFVGTGFEVSRVNFTELNRDSFECSDENKLYDDGHPGRVKSLDGTPKDLQNCIEDFYHRELKCRLPWGKYILLWNNSAKAKCI